jgi:hypothetical protein
MDRRSLTAIVATLVVRMFTIALLLVMLYPSPMHLLHVY